MAEKMSSLRSDIAALYGADIAAEAHRMVALGRKMNLKSDSAFKLFFSNDSPEANACLRSFLSAAIGKKIKEVSVTNAELLPEFVGGKRPRLDVNCIFDGGRQADIELQLAREDDDQLLRSVFYACKLYAGTLKGGELYKKAPSTYQIFLLDFKLFDDDRFYHRGMFRLDNGTVMTENLQVRFFEFPKTGGMNNKKADLKKVKNWCTFIAGCNDPTVIERLSQDKTWQEELKMAWKSYTNVSEEERAWAYHLSYDRAEADYRNGLLLAEEKGIKAGKEEIVRRMLAKHIPIETISECSGLSLGDIQKLYS